MELRKFGLEIRKTGDVKNRYSDVDLVLHKAGIEKGGVSTTVQTQAIAHALQKMFSSDKHMDVCTIRECAKIAQIVISEERMEIYSSQHCTNWSEMLPDFRATLAAMILDDFRDILNPQSIHV
jgi:hypothetical protein